MLCIIFPDLDFEQAIVKMIIVLKVLESDIEILFRLSLIIVMHVQKTNNGIMVEEAA